MNTQPKDGAPTPENYAHALKEASHWIYKTSEIASALRGLAGAIGDGDYPPNPDNLPGLGLAITLVGESLSSHAIEREAFLKILLEESRALEEKSDKARAG